MLICHQWISNWIISKKKKEKLLEVGWRERTHHHARVDTYDRDEHGDEGKGCELAHELDTDEDTAADDDQEESAVDAEVVEGVRLHLDVADYGALGTHVLEENLDSAHNVHAGGHRVA